MVECFTLSRSPGYTTLSWGEDSCLLNLPFFLQHTSALQKMPWLEYLFVREVGETARGKNNERKWSQCDLMTFLILLKLGLCKHLVFFVDVLNFIQLSSRYLPAQAPLTCLSCAWRSCWAWCLLVLETTYVDLQAHSSLAVCVHRCVCKPCSPEPCTGGPHTSQQHCISGCAQTSFKLPVWWISFFAVWEICSALCESTEDLCSFLFLLEASYRALEKHFISASALYLRGNTGIFPAGSIWIFWRKDVGLLASKSQVWKVASNYHCSMDK